MSIDQRLANRRQLKELQPLLNSDFQGNLLNLEPQQFFTFLQDQPMSQIQDELKDNQMKQFEDINDSNNDSTEFNKRLKIISFQHELLKQKALNNKQLQKTTSFLKTQLPLKKFKGIEMLLVIDMFYFLFFSYGLIENELVNASVDALINGYQEFFENNYFSKDEQIKFYVQDSFVFFNILNEQHKTKIVKFLENILIQLNEKNLEQVNKLTFKFGLIFETFQKEFEIKDQMFYEILNQNIPKIISLQIQNIKEINQISMPHIFLAQDILKTNIDKNTSSEIQNNLVNIFLNTDFKVINENILHTIFHKKEFYTHQSDQQFGKIMDKLIQLYREDSSNQNQNVSISCQINPLLMKHKKIFQNEKNKEQMFNQLINELANLYDKQINGKDLNIQKVVLYNIIKIIIYIPQLQPNFQQIIIKDLNSSFKKKLAKDQGGRYLKIILDIEQNKQKFGEEIQKINLEEFKVIGNIQFYNHLKKIHLTLDRIKQTYKLHNYKELTNDIGFLLNEQEGYFPQLFPQFIPLLKKVFKYYEVPFLDSNPWDFLNFLKRIHILEGHEKGKVDPEFWQPL